MTEINTEFNKDKAIKSLSIICNQNLDVVPDWQTIQDVIEDLIITKLMILENICLKLF